LKGSEAESAQR